MRLAGIALIVMLSSCSRQDDDVNRDVLYGIVTKPTGVWQMATNSDAGPNDQKLVGLSKAACMDRVREFNKGRAGPPLFDAKCTIWFTNEEYRLMASYIDGYRSNGSPVVIVGNHQVFVFDTNLVLKEIFQGH